MWKTLSNLCGVDTNSVHRDLVLNINEVLQCNNSPGNFNIYLILILLFQFKKPTKPKPILAYSLQHTCERWESWCLDTFF